MNQQFLKEIEMGSKNALVKKRIITHYIYNGSSTIPDLSKELDLSVPTVTKFIGEMCEDGYIQRWTPPESLWIESGIRLFYRCRHQKICSQYRTDQF